MTPAYGLDSFMMPVSGTITSLYGMRWGRMHQGVDISAPVGTPVLAADDGIVAFVGQRRGYGNVVELHHADGSITRYAHNWSLD
ncbi:MAG TPA: M23 family metallopeptidase [Chroococcidiopsis sp.]